MRKFLAGIYITAAGFIGFVAFVGVAQALQSTNYRFSEPSLGGIGSADTASAGYKALTSGGIIGFGNTKGTDFQVDPGHETTDEPALSFAVASSNVTFPTFSATAASTTTSTFAVSNYTSYGYIVQVLGSAPSNGAHTIAAMSSTGPSTAGSEQFGINLVANTSPNSVGLNPDQGQFGFGVAATNYNTSNNYRYVSGETVAMAPKSSGVTIYTMSYMVNVSNITPGGQYSGNQTILCTATF